jgi:hypothetical protein
MSDLMTKMSTEERNPPSNIATIPKTVSGSCSACGKGISRSDEIVNMDSRVRQARGTEMVFYHIGI